MELAELREHFTATETKYLELRRYLDLDSHTAQLNQLREQSAVPAFWNDNAAASSVLKKISLLEKEIALWNDLERRHGDLEVLMEFAEAGAATSDEVQLELREYRHIIEDLELKMMLGEEQDVLPAILQIHPGAGGTESQDWADMLSRMYKRWFEKKGFEVDILDYQPGDEAGIKDVTFEIQGDYAYGLLKAEAGIHRLVRISPFDANSRRHTSFASVFVYPAVTEDIEIEINPSELRIDTFRASGAGGQHVNKTDSAIRITHLPTGIVVSCQNERSQHKNKAQALKVLKSRLYQIEIDRERDAHSELEKSKLDIGWGSQIRSYVFHPYNMVKDHRTKEETGNVQAVMDGEIDRFIRAYLLWQMKDSAGKKV
ncbi:MAG: peptide chain release factor 2 [Candidatus Neomarinimicrobiota bacterium]